MLRLLLAVLTNALLVSGANAADLNAPLNNRPTLGSEIHRGIRAASACYFIHDNEFHPDSFSGCIDTRDSANTQSLPGYKPFSLGIHFQAWLWHDIAITISAKSPRDKFIKDISKRSAVYAPLEFEMFRKLQHDLGVSDAQLMQIAEIPPAGIQDTYERISYWALKTGH